MKKANLHTLSLKTLHHHAPQDVGGELWAEALPRLGALRHLRELSLHPSDSILRNSVADLAHLAAAIPGLAGGLRVLRVHGPYKPVATPSAAAEASLSFLGGLSALSSLAIQPLFYPGWLSRLASLTALEMGASRAWTRGDLQSLVALPGLRQLSLGRWTPGDGDGAGAGAADFAASPSGVTHLTCAPESWASLGPLMAAFPSVAVARLTLAFLGPAFDAGLPEGAAVWAHCRDLSLDVGQNSGFGYLLQLLRRPECGRGLRALRYQGKAVSGYELAAALGAAPALEEAALTPPAKRGFEEFFQEFQRRRMYGHGLRSLHFLGSKGLKAAGIKAAANALPTLQSLTFEGMNEPRYRELLGELGEAGRPGDAPGRNLLPAARAALARPINVAAYFSAYQFL
jgi:hypothetical protein